VGAKSRCLELNCLDKDNCNYNVIWFVVVSIPMMTLRTVYGLFERAFTDWRHDKASRLGAALAYYTLFSVSPSLIIVIAVAGLLFGEQAAQGQILAQIQAIVGPDVAGAIQGMLESAQRPSSGILATLVGLLTLLIGATGVLVELQDALNTVWEVPRESGTGLWEIIKNRLVSLAILLAGGFLLLLSLALSAMLGAIGHIFGTSVPGWVYFGHAADLFLSFGLATLLFAMIFKYLPDIEIRWNDVWIGAAVTAFLFTIGKILIGLFIGRSTVASIYGAAGSLVALLVWVYYSTQIFFFGAEFTQVYATRSVPASFRASPPHNLSTQYQTTMTKKAGSPRS
jgi:membrane protein